MHATFLFHPQVFRVTTYGELGGLRTEWGYGDEVELHLRIEAACGLAGIRHIPHVLYQYRRNTSSVVHDPRLYARLIENIESMLLARMRDFYPDFDACRRFGRAASTHAAHYEYIRNGDRVEVPWFDFASSDISA